jgi:hypothetical protein
MSRATKSRLNRGRDLTDKAGEIEQGFTVIVSSFKLSKNVSMSIESPSTYKWQLQFISKSETIQQLLLQLEQQSIDCQ